MSGASPFDGLMGTLDYPLFHYGSEGRQFTFHRAKRIHPGHEA